MADLVEHSHMHTQENTHEFADTRGGEHEHDHEEVCGCEHEPDSERACDCEHEHEHTHTHEGHAHHNHACSCCHHEEIDPQETNWWKLHRETVLMAISGVALICGIIAEHLIHAETLSHVLYVIAALAGVVFVWPAAISALKRKTADMNVLMGIAVIGALIMGFLGDTSVFFDAALVIFLDQVGEWLEDWSMDKTSRSIEELSQLVPSEAHVVSADGSVADRAISEVQISQHIRILAGERVPLDGVIVQGTSSFNEAAITGESVPVDKSLGDEVYAGSLNESGVVELRVSADEDCSTLARIVSLVQGAQAERAPYESFVNRFAASYTPIVIVAALILGLIIPLFLGFTGGFSGKLWHTWVYRALSILVVACPCALVISTPVSFVSAITRAAQNGVLVKGGAHFDTASKVNTLAFDKTGTLTQGTPRVVSVMPVADATENDVLELAFALENNSTHPLAKAVSAYAQAQGITLAELKDAEEITGNGVVGTIAGLACAIGKLSFIEQFCEVPQELKEAISVSEEQGVSVLVVAGNGRCAGALGLADTLRDNSVAIIDRLSQDGIESIEMLTGDNERTAQRLAHELGLTSYKAGLLPEDKLARIASLKGEGKSVAMVGDGINDAPALAASNLGITMGAAASDTALEVADVALLQDNLDALPGFFRLARRTMNVVRENIAFAIGVKILVFILIVVGAAGMGAAVFADTGVSLIVILNGMRLMTNWDTRA